jgi:hypothetical protein
LRKRRDALPLLLGALCAVLLLASPGVRAQAPARPTDREIREALASLKADPNLSGTRTITLPRWGSTSTVRETPSWLQWLVALMRFLAQSSRALLWGALIVAALALLVYFIRTLASRQEAEAADRLVTPTHVRDLDIRPESLPPDIGAAARQLWDAGRHRAALALLYRGLLSRLAHVHRLAIRDSTTEGDCLALTQAHLAAERHQYSSRLVRVWQRAVYGGSDPESSAVYDLCDTFSAALDGASPEPQVTP